MATKARKAKIAKRTSAVSNKLIRLAKAKRTSANSKKWIIEEITRYRGLLIPIPPNWSGGYTISFADPAISAFVLDGVNPNKITLEKQAMNKGIGGIDTYLCKVTDGRQNSYWRNTVFFAVGDVALAPPAFKDTQLMDVAAPYPAATLANANNVATLFSKIKQNVDSQTERLLGAIIDNGKVKYLCLYRLRNALQIQAGLGDVIFVSLYDPATDVDGGFPGGTGVGSRP